MASSSAEQEPIGRVFDRQPGLSRDMHPEEVSVGAVEKRKASVKAYQTIKKPKTVDGRSLRESNNAAPSLDSLGTEIIAMILDMLDQDSPRTISSVALVNSFYYQAARYSQSRVLFVGDNVQAAKKRIDYVTSAGLLPAVRRLVVRQSLEAETATDLAICLLAQLPGLKDIEWQTLNTIPPEAISALRERSDDVRLHTVITTPLISPREPSLSMAHLASCNNIRSIQVSFCASSSKNRRLFANAVRPILASCPNLSILSINITVPRGCVRPDPPSCYTGFGFKPGERIAPLEEFRLLCYDWGGRWTYPAPLGASSPEDLDVNYPGEGLEIDYWVENFDWSRLKRLKAMPAQADFVNAVAPKLTALEEMSFDHSWDRKAILRFFSQINTSLKALTIDRLAGIGVPRFVKHGANLRRLEIHQVEVDNWDITAIRAEQLLLIRQRCPLLEELTVDVRRNGEWPYDILDILAAFPRLRRLKIWFRLGSYRKRAPGPVVNFSAARHLFQYMLAKRPQGLPQLKQLEIGSGSPRILHGGYPGAEAFWPEYNSTTFICRIAERDDEVAKGMFSVECPKLSREANELLEKLDRGDQDVDPDAVPQGMAGREFRVARFGPDDRNY